MPRSRIPSLSAPPRLLAGTVLALLAAVSNPAPALGQIAPFSSWHKLSWSNGYAAGYYDVESRRVRSFRHHLYASYDETTSTRDLMFDLFFGLRVGGSNTWLTDVPVTASFEGNTGMVRAEQTFGSVRATQHYFSPFTVDAPVVVAVITIENLGSTPLADAAVFSLQNLHIGNGSGGADNESITWNNGAFEERGPNGDVIVHTPYPAPTVHGASPQNPWQLVTNGGHMLSVDASGTINDAVAGFEWDATGLAAGASRSFAVVLSYDIFGNRSYLDGQLAPLSGKAADALVTDAIADWTAFHAPLLEPAGLSADERTVYRRQLAILRMAQVREPKPSRGQIVASLPPGMWNIAWVRDAGYAVPAMIRAGMFAAAKEALEFLMTADAGHYVCCDLNGGPYVGEPYAISITRYFGNGKEETDYNDKGPNIEFDGFGLTLMNIAQYVEATGDTAFVTTHETAIFARTADVLVNLIQNNGPGSGLVRADSSIWETHWENGGRRHHTYTQATSAAGLRAAARLATAVGRTADATRYQAAGDALAAAIQSRLVDPSNMVLRSSLEETTNYLDGAAIEAFNWDVIAADGPIAAATLDAFRAFLWNGVVGHGYRRNDDGDAYDLREWVIIDLRIARAARRAGRASHADDIVAWITDQARLNYDLVPENFDRITGAYLGEIPMAGFGAGTYVSALWERTDTYMPPDGDGGVGSDGGVGGDAGVDGGPAVDGGGDGCGCQTNGGTGAGWAPLFLATVAVLGRRRRRAATR